MKMFNAFAQKSLFVYGGQTSVAGTTMSENTQIVFDKGVVDLVKQRYGSVMNASPEMSLPTISVSSAGEMTSASVKGVNDDYFDIKILDVTNGRRINHLDIVNYRNVAVIGDGVQKSLFSMRDAIGKNVEISGALFKVVGILSSESIFSMQERNTVYIPSTTFLDNFDSEGNISSFCLALSSDANTSAIEKDLRSYLAYRYGFDPHDKQAVYVANIEKQTESFESLFRGLEALIWVVGICLLLSGIVGVCNVMLIIVKERTNEIGIRKAVGATSRSIISMILTESVTITFISGVIGIVAGALLVMIADKVILPALNTKVLDNIQINIPVVLAAFVILCLSGVVAGLFPALKASQISPVDAIRYENRG